MEPDGTLVLTREHVAGLLTAGECIRAVEAAFKTCGEGKARPPGILGVHARDGGFHVKAGIMGNGKEYFAAKINANFPGNMDRSGLPAIQGIIYLADAASGYPLAVMDSIEITIRRTSAATAVAAKYLARRNSKSITVIGCGNQGRANLESLLSVLPLREAFVYDIDRGKARAAAGAFSRRLRVTAIESEQLPASLKKSDICVTCTPSKRFLVNADDVPAGMFIAAVGADNEEKQELDPRLFRSAKVVTDLTAQCRSIGDLHHALSLGLLKESEVYGELGEIVAGRKTGRTSGDEVILFDSTGMALQDAAAASLVYEKALVAGTGNRVHLN